MNKAIKIIFAALVCVMLLSVFGCGETDVPDGMITASTDADSFNFYVPKAWVVNSSSGTASAYYSSTDQSNVSFVAMVMDSDCTTLEEYEAKAEESLKGALPGFSGLSEKKDTVLCGKTARSFEYSATVDGTEYRFRQYVTVDSHSFYVLTYTAKSDLFESHLEDLDKIAENVSFK